MLTTGLRTALPSIHYFTACILGGYDSTHSGIDFPNGVLSFFLQLCNTSRNILIDSILENNATDKVQRAQIWAAWRPLANSFSKKFCQKGHRVFRHMWSRIILLKTAKF